jgi:hypothetical protein
MNIFFKLGLLFALSALISASAFSAGHLSAQSVRAARPNVIEGRSWNGKRTILLDRDRGDLFVYDRRNGATPVDTVFDVGDGAGSRRFKELAATAQQVLEVEIGPERHDLRRIVTVHHEDGAPVVRVWNQDLSSVRTTVVAENALAETATILGKNRILFGHAYRPGKQILVNLQTGETLSVRAEAETPAN